MKALLPEGRLTTLLAGLGLLLLVLAAHGPALGGGFIWDDDTYVTENPVLPAEDGLAWIWTEPRATPQYYPLVHTTFWLEYRLWGLEPMGFHAVNLLLHALGAVLLWGVLRRLKVPAAWLAAALFAVHPVHVESVAWVTERKNVLSGVFYLAAAWAYLRFERPEDDEVIRWWPGYGLAFFLFVAALLSKSVTATLPAALVLVYVWKRGRLRLRTIWPLVPMLVVGIAAGLHTAWLERVHVGAEGAMYELSVWERLLVAGRGWWFYATKLVWPTDLAFIYPRWDPASAGVVDGLILLAALMVPVGLWLARRRIGSGPLVAVLFFGGTLVPAIGFFNVYPFRFSFVADHFQYLASIGILVLMAAGVDRGWRAVARSAETAGRWRPVVWVVPVAVLALLAHDRAWSFTSSERLWERSLAANPRSWLGQNELGIVRRGAGDLDGAIVRFSRAVELNPKFLAARVNLAEALRTRGRTREAMAQLEAALEQHPRYGPARLARGLMLAERGELERAWDQLERAADAMPRSAVVQHRLGLVRQELGHDDAAGKHFQR
ncbi:MAG: tetratricopeptide repeat protein, partial [Phycisphaeraceae bacterium]|nr:tetratricopeptide repeat protein [Phycisphaeraceae bacterium]